MQERSRIARTCPENSDLIEEFIIFVQENKSRIKPPTEGEDDSPSTSSPKNIVKQPAESIVIGANSNESPMSRGTMLEASKMNDYLSEHDNQPILLPVVYE